MQIPSPDPDTIFEDLLQDLPPETIAMAYEFKAFTRARKIQTPHHLLRAVLLYGGLDQTLREVAGTMTLLVNRITDTSIAERLAACRPWVNALLPKMLGHPEQVTLPQHRQFVVIDGSTVQGPGATGTHYRLHIGLDLVTLEFTHLLITDVRTGESLRHFPLGAGQVGIADRGYCHPKAVVETVHAGADLILRLNPHSMPLSQPDGTPLDVVAALGSQVPTTIRTLPVYVNPAQEGTPVQGWVHAYRLSEEQANKARAACYKRNSKKGRTPQQTTLLLAGWVLVWTSLPPEQLAAHTILALYRLRWQVELAIKRCKSLLDVDLLRARNGSPLAELWLHGKLLYALLVDKRLRRTMGDSWGRLDRERTATWWRPWKLMHTALAVQISGALCWPGQQWADGVQMMSERPRRRTLQRLPAALCPLPVPDRIDTALDQPWDEEWEKEIAA